MAGPGWNEKGFARGFVETSEAAWQRHIDELDKPKTGLCEKCGTEQPLDDDGRVMGHKAPRARKFCLGGGGRPRRAS